MPSTSSSPAAAAVASTLIGAATGLRSQIGVATVIAGAPRSALPAMLRHTAVKPVVVALAFGELVVDKLPSVPARTAAPALAARVALGALSAWLVSPTSGRAAVRRAATGAAVAAGAAFGGLAARSRLSRRLAPVPAALIEDAVAIGLAVTALRLGARSASRVLDGPADPPAPPGAEAR